MRHIGKTLGNFFLGLLFFCHYFWFIDDRNLNGNCYNRLCKYSKALYIESNISMVEVAVKANRLDVLKLMLKSPVFIWRTAM